MPLAALDRRLQLHSAVTDANASAAGIAIVSDGREFTYAELVRAVDDASQSFEQLGIGAGDAVLLSCGFSFAAITAFLALLRLNAVAVLSAPDDPQLADKQAAVNARVHLQYPLTKPLGEHGVLPAPTEQHPLVSQLVESGHPGFVVFSSGSTGTAKAVLHDASRFCAHLEGVSKAKSTVGFLSFDHIAGVDTLFYTLFAGGSLVVPADRSPLAVCSAVATYHAQVLPVSPSFLKLLLISPALEQYDLSSLEIITFGSEPPDPVITQRLGELLPDTALLQKYGTSEFGAPRSQTRPGDSRWIKLTSDTLATDVRDGILWVRASGTMLGYLNVESPDVSDGWFCTGDRVLQDGEWLRILGRDSDMINVGGEKVFPAEVESVVEQMDEVLECAVTGESHQLLGNIVVATIRLSENASVDGAWPKAKSAIRRHCKSKLPRHAIPVKVRITEQALTSSRGKRLRQGSD